MPQDRTVLLSQPLVKNAVGGGVVNRFLVQLFFTNVDLKNSISSIKNTIKAMSTARNYFTVSKMFTALAVSNIYC